MPNITLQRSRLFLERGKYKKVIALFEIEGHYLKREIDVTAVQTRSIAGPPARTVSENYTQQNKSVIEYVTESGVEYTIFKVYLKGRRLYSRVKSLTLVNDFTFTITLDDPANPDPIPIAAPDVPADDFDPCDFS